MMLKNGNEAFVAVREYDSAKVEHTYVVVDIQNPSGPYEESLVKDPKTKFFRFELGEEVVVKVINEITVKPKPIV